MSRVTILTTALNEYSRNNEFSFRGDVQRSLMSLQERIDELQVIRGDNASRSSLRRGHSNIKVGTEAYNV